MHLGCGSRHDDAAGAPSAQDAAYRLSRLRLAREEEWAQETQRSINEDAAARAPARLQKLFLVTLSKASRDLRASLLEDDALAACVDDLDRAGFAAQLPTGTAVFTYVGTKSKSTRIFQ